MKSNPSKKKAVKGKVVQPSRNEDVGVTEEKSRTQRKQIKQIEFQKKLKDGPRNLSASKTLQKKKRKRTREKAAKVLDSISSLADSLPSKEEIMKLSAAVQKRAPSSKSHQNVVVKETKQLASVLAHPQFQSNPFLAIQKHLMNTLPAAELPPPKTKDQEKKKRTKSTKKVEDMMVE
ncbi:unnamed protein product [Calypogeia fissa]